MTVLVTITAMLAMRPMSTTLITTPALYGKA